VLFPTTISSAWPVSKKVFGTYTPFWDGFSLSDSSKNQNGRRKSFAERLARGAKIKMADFFREIGHLCFANLQFSLLLPGLSHVFKLSCIRVRAGISGRTIPHSSWLLTNGRGQRVIIP